MATETFKAPEPVEALANVSRTREGGSERRGFHGLDRNERVGNLPDWFLEEVRAGVTSSLLTDYPSVDELEDELAEATGLPREQLLVTPGTDPAIKATYQSYVRPGDTVVMLDPSYAMYAVYARMFGANALGIGYDRELMLDTAALLDALESTKARVAFIAEPNQPTGTTLPEGFLRTILETAGRAGTLVFVDEAYWYFARRTALPLVSEFPNLIVARSFSKAGLAGARIGFLAAGEEVVSTLYKVRSAAEVNAFGILCGRALLAHPEVATDFADDVEAGATLLSERAEALGLEPLPTAANFLQIRMNGQAEPRDVADRLRARGWLVKVGFSTPGLTDCVRVTLGAPDVMAEFADELAAVLA